MIIILKYFISSNIYIALIMYQELCNYLRSKKPYRLGIIIIVFIIILFYRLIG